MQLHCQLCARLFHSKPHSTVSYSEFSVLTYYKRRTELFHQKDVYFNLPVNSLVQGLMIEHTEHEANFSERHCKLTIVLAAEQWKLTEERSKAIQRNITTSSHVT
jgi:hypothetical protein